MFAFLMAMWAAPAAAAAPFVLTGATLSRLSAGTSCGSPAVYRVYWTYTGDATGKTVSLEELMGGVIAGTVGSSISASLGTYDYNSNSYGTTGAFRDQTCRVTDDSDAGNTVDSNAVNASRTQICV